MSSNESMAYDAAMHQYEKQYDGLKAELQTLGFIGQGSVSTRRITCGRPACRCHSDPEARHVSGHVELSESRHLSVFRPVVEFVQVEVPTTTMVFV